MKFSKAFTVVELLTVIVVIGILATLTIVSYQGINAQAKDVAIVNEISRIEKKLEEYKIRNGGYPATQVVALTSGGSTGMSYIDSGCTAVPTGANVTKSSDWIPGINIVLPQSSGQTGSRGSAGCYIYQSDGSLYILSAWNMAATGPQASKFYRRVGYREIANQQFYYCNHGNIGAATPAPYTATSDYYKYSYTISNITSCNETPPAGA